MRLPMSDTPSPPAPLPTCPRCHVSGYTDIMRGQTVILCRKCGNRLADGPMRLTRREGEAGAVTALGQATKPWSNGR